MHLDKESFDNTLPFDSQNSLILKIQFGVQDGSRVDYYDLFQVLLIKSSLHTCM